MIKIAFLLGRPGSGKSSIASLIQMFAHHHGWLIHSTNDYEHLKKMFYQEKAEWTSLEERNFLQRESERCNGFDVLNFSVLGTVLEEMRNEVKVVRDTCPQDKITVCTVEFARANYHDALQLFGSNLLQDAYLLYLDVDLENCIERNHRRSDHFVSDEIMTTYYREDDWSRVMYNLQHNWEKCVIRNSGTLQDLEQEVEEWVDGHLVPEVVSLDSYVTVS